MRTIDPLAMRQLANWEGIARDWPVYTSEAGYVRCAYDDMAVWRNEDNQGEPYQHSDLELLALRVGHLRQHHPQLEPNNDTT